MFKTVTLLSLSLLLSFSPLAFGDRDVSPRYTRTISSQDGRYFLVMMPSEKISSTGSDCLWTVYETKDSGSFTERWHADGFYSRQVFLANDGDSLVCVEDWPHGKPKKTDVLMAFYIRGEIGRVMRLENLVANMDTLSQSTSHYRWLKENQKPSIWLVRGRHLFLNTSDDRTFECDIVAATAKEISFD